MPKLPAVQGRQNGLAVSAMTSARLSADVTQHVIVELGQLVPLPERCLELHRWRAERPANQAIARMRTPRDGPLGVWIVSVQFRISSFASLRRA